MLVAFKNSLTELETPNYKIALELGINPNRLSRIIMEITAPTLEEKKKLATRVGKKIEEIFPGPQPPEAA